MLFSMGLVTFTFGITHSLMINLYNELNTCIVIMIIFIIRLKVKRFYANEKMFSLHAHHWISLLGIYPEELYYGFGQRWQHRKTLNSPPPSNTLNSHLQTALPPEKELRADWERPQRNGSLGSVLQPQLPAV